jgi:hypothetical protein
MLCKGQINGLALLVAITFLCLASRLGTHAAAIRDRLMTEDDRYYLPPSTWLRFFCVGYNEAAADVVWIKTLVYFGRQFKATSDVEERYTTNYLLTAVDLDPRFRSLYTYGNALTLFQNNGKVNEKTVKMAMELLERGVEEFPGDGEILFQLGFMHFYEMRPFMSLDGNDPKRRFHNELGARLIARSALLKGAPPYASRLSASIMGKAGLEDMVVDHLRALLGQETEPSLRELLASKLRAALGKAAERDIAETERLKQKWLAAMPYIPYDFFLILETDTPLEEWLDPLYLFNSDLGF